MNKMKINFIALMVLVLGVKAYASITSSHMWDSVNVETERGFSVKLARNLQTLKIEKFQVSLESKMIQIPKKWFEDINQPLFRTLDITWSCPPLIFNDDGKIIDKPCNDYISFEYLEDIGQLKLPNWYENPKVTFYFEDGKLLKRLKQNKTSESDWKKSWIHMKSKKVNVGCVLTHRFIGDSQIVSCS